MNFIGRCVIGTCLGLGLASVAIAQTLSDELVARIFAGAARVVVPGESVTVPLVGTPTLPLVEVSVNGKGPYRLLIDLGANVTLLRRDVVTASGSVVLVDRATSDIVRVDSITLGKATLEDLTVGAYDELDVDGVLGYNVLQYSSFTLDFPGQRLVLHHQALPPPDDVKVFSYELRGRMPFVKVSAGGIPLVVNLDTGASEWMTIPPALQARLRWKAEPAPGRSVSNNQTGSTQVLEGRLAGSLRLGPLEIPSPLIYVNPDAEGPWLGAAAMNQAVWTFDPPHKRLEITMAKAPR
jgi:hypothetical protein